MRSARRRVVASRINGVAPPFPGIDLSSLSLNIAGSVAIFGAALLLIIRESVAIDQLTRVCLDAGRTCFPNPSGFTRYAIYAFIALFDVFALFTVSLSVEHRVRRRGYDPEWR
jgi:hypothetical protein